MDGAPVARALAGSEVVASLEGRPLTVTDFLAFLERARGPGYRPSSAAEAVRLVRAQLRSRALQLEALDHSAPADPSAPRVADLVQELTRSATVSESEIAGLRARHDHLQALGRPEELGALRRRFERRRASLQGAAYLDSLLDDLDVRIDVDRLRELVRRAPSGPPLPPGYVQRAGL